MSRRRKTGCVPRGHSRAICLLACLAAAALLSGCGEKVVLTLGLNREEIFSVGNRIGHGYELRVYLANIGNEYRSTMGQTALNRAGDTVVTSIRDNALARLCKVKVLDMMAENRGIFLDETEDARAHQMANAYYASLSEEDLAYLKVRLQDLSSMYQDYSIAQKVYDSIIRSVDTEISDDEARTVTVQGILIKTYTTDAAGNRVEFTDAQKQEAKARAESILQEIRDGMANLTGVPFTTWISRYNEDDQSEYTLGRGDADDAFVDAAFRAKIGQISDVVETADGYRILKGISSSGEARNKARKEEMIRLRQEDTFEKEYDSFVSDIDYRISEDDWEALTFPEDAGITTDRFFEIYDSFSEAEPAKQPGS